MFLILLKIILFAIILIAPALIARELIPAIRGKAKTNAAEVELATTEEA